MRSVWLPSGHIPLREPPCPERQVGEGDALALDAGYRLPRQTAEINKATARLCAVASICPGFILRTYDYLLKWEFGPKLR